MAEKTQGETAPLKRGANATEQDAIIRNMLAQNASIADIADALRLTDRTVRRRIHRINVADESDAASLGSNRAEADFENPDIDPIRSIVGASVTVSSFANLKWPSNRFYCNVALRRAVKEAALFAYPREAPLVTATHLAVALINSASKQKGTPLKRYLSLLDSVIDRTREIRERPGIHGEEILGWDAVEVLVNAAALRDRLFENAKPLSTELVLPAFFHSRAGQEALIEVGLGDVRLQPFRDFALAVFDDYVGRHQDASREVAQKIIREIQTVQHFQRASVHRAGFASDSVDATNVDPTIRADARALADLILLEAAAPPLAIGVFGSWGSGKSTLLAALKKEITEQLADEQSVTEAARAEQDLATRRVPGAILVELNAWTFVDTENLWASLTSDIFEQIAAGGKDKAQAKIGAELVAEVADRTGKEAGLLRAAQAQLEKTRQKRAILEKKLAQAERDLQLSGADAALQVALELLGPKKEEKDGDGSKTTREKTPSYVEIFRRTALLTSENPEEQIRQYAKAATGVGRFIDMAKDFYQGSKTRAIVMLGAGLVLGALLWFLAPTFLVVSEAWRPYAKPIAAFLGLTAPVAFYILPAARLAMTFAKHLKTKQGEANEARLTALKDLEDLAAAEAEAEAGIASSSKLLEKYSEVREGGSAASVVLDYLLEDSSEISKIRGSLGTLGTVRKAFEKLNALVQSREHSGNVHRIIITIDDLDRCSEKQVVQILEAIHLLLAYPCFVVVAAVDARWLTTALTKAHTQLADQSSNVTSADYLEKIFQIPFWVRPLRSRADAPDGGSYGRLIDELTATRKSDPDLVADAGAADAQISEPISEAEQVEEGEASNKALSPIPPFKMDASEAPRRERVSLDNEEIALFRKLGVLASRSPRAVKRMINIYRLVRAQTISEGDRVFIVGPEGELIQRHLVQFALACDAGLPPSVVARIAGVFATMAEPEWMLWEAILNDERATLDGPTAQILDPQQLQLFLKALRVTVESTNWVIEASDLRNAFIAAERFSFRHPTPPTNDEEE